MVALNESLPPFTIKLFEIKLTNFTSKGLLLFEHALLFSFDQRGIPFSVPVKSGQCPSLFSFFLVGETIFSKEIGFSEDTTLRIASETCRSSSRSDAKRFQTTSSSLFPRLRP